MDIMFRLIYIALIFSIGHINIMAQESINFSGISEEKFVIDEAVLNTTNDKLKELLLIGIEISVDNIVNANTTRTSDSKYSPYKYKYLVIDTDLSFSVMEKDKYKTVYNPTHPDAIKKGELTGYVLYPLIDIEKEYLDIQEMIRILRTLNSILLLVTHPLEPISLTSYDFTKTQYSFTQGQYYVAPGNGVIKEVIQLDELYQITLSLDDKTEVVYSGLSEVVKNEYEKVHTGELLGKDYTISENTKYILMFYEKANLFPQFIDNDLLFPVNRGTKAYMIADGVVVDHGWKDSLQEFGTYVNYELAEKKTNVIYMYLTQLHNRINSFVKQGEVAAYTGDTGETRSPALKVRFYDDDLGTDIRVIYLHVPHRIGNSE
jgi:flagellar basal body rod protein FlgC